MSHSALLRSVAARLPAEYREAYLEGFARVRAERVRDGDGARGTSAEVVEVTGSAA